MPPPITAQVATVRQRISLPANFQIASRQATTATRMQVLVVQNEIALTTSGFRKPLPILRRSNSFISILLCGKDDQIRPCWAQIGDRADAQRKMSRVVTHPHSQLQ